jgi:hypothetical protein
LKPASVLALSLSLLLSLPLPPLLEGCVIRQDRICCEADGNFNFPEAPRVQMDRI